MKRENINNRHTEPCAPSKDDVPREYDKDSKLAGGNNGYANDELSNSEKAEKYCDSGDDKIADGDYKGAVEDLSEAIRLNPHNHRYYSLRGVAYYETGRYEAAIQDENKSIELKPSPPTLYNRAEAFYKTGKDREALDDLEYALKLAHEIPDYDFLIPECQKLISIIKDKSISREDYHQPPKGWEKLGRRSIAPHYEPKTPPAGSKNGVFLMRAKGQSFEEFKEFCVKRFREAGLLKD